MIYFYFVFAFVYIFDRVTKIMALKYLSNGEITVIQKVLYFNLIFNKGGAFGILQSKFWIFFSANILVLIFFIIYYKELKKLDLSYKIAIGAILGASLGNFTDRVIRGSVIDFIDFRIWPIFNVADMFITVSVVFLFFKLILPHKKCENLE